MSVGLILVEIKHVQVLAKLEFCAYSLTSFSKSYMFMFCCALHGEVPKSNMHLWQADMAITLVGVSLTKLRQQIQRCQLMEPLTWRRSWQQIRTTVTSVYEVVTGLSLTMNCILVILALALLAI